jgi:hypothetical protein
MPIKLTIENTKSRTGKHIAISIIIDLKDFSLLSGKTASKGTYSQGKCNIIEVPDRGEFLYIWFVRNLRGRVIGKAKIINDGKIEAEGKYKKLKLRIKGNINKEKVELIKAVLNKYKIPIKRISILV